MNDILSFEQFTRALQSYVTESEQIIEKLKQIKRYVENSHKAHNAVKTVGTTSGLAAGLPDLPLFAENFRFSTLFPHFFRSSAFFRFLKIF